MDQGRLDNAAQSTNRPRWSRRAHAVLAIAAGCYPIGCFLLMKCSWDWLALTPYAGLIYVVLVPASAIGAIIALREAGVPVRRRAVGYFALWVGVVAALRVCLMLFWYAGV